MTLLLIVLLALTLCLLDYLKSIKGRRNLKPPKSRELESKPPKSILEPSALDWPSTDAYDLSTSKRSKDYKERLRNAEQEWMDSTKPLRSEVYVTFIETPNKPAKTKGDLK